MNETSKNYPEDLGRFQLLQDTQLKEWEALCRRCGACCGAIEGDFCEHLRKDNQGQYGCNIYEERFGIHKTISGKEMTCVPIRKIIHESWPGDRNCGYKSFR